MSKRVQAPRVKAAVQEIVSLQGDKPISVDIIAQKLRDNYSDAIAADTQDLVSYGLGVAIGRISSRPVQDEEIRDLFGGGATHELVSLRGLDGGKVHITKLTAPLWIQQPSRPQRAVEPHRSQEQIFDEAAREMMENGTPQEMPIVEYLKSKKR